MRKLSTLTLIAVSALSLAAAIPTLAKDNEKSNKSINGENNPGLHLGQIKQLTKTPKAKPTRADKTAYQAAIKKAQADYKAAKEKARIEYLAALKAARDQFLNPPPTTGINLGPTVAVAASVSTSPIISTNAILSVLGADDKGEINLIYKWTIIAKPAGTADPVFSINNSNAAKNTMVTFSQAGTYQFLVTVTDAGLLNASSSVGVTVNQKLSHVIVTPATATLGVTSTAQLSATSSDQFNNPISSGFTWSIFEGAIGGSVNSIGLYTAPATTGTFHVVATSNIDITKSDSAAVTVTP